MRNYILSPVLLLKVLFYLGVVLYSCLPALGTELSNTGLYVIPYPQQLKLGSKDFRLDNKLKIVLDKNHSVADKK